jgi:hypothetical protein
MKVEGGRKDMPGEEVSSTDEDVIEEKRWAGLVSFLGSIQPVLVCAERQRTFPWEPKPNDKKFGRGKTPVI